MLDAVFSIVPLDVSYSVVFLIKKACNFSDIRPYKNKGSVFLKFIPPRIWNVLEIFLFSSVFTFSFF